MEKNMNKGDINEKIDKLILAFLAGTLTLAEKKELERWLSASEYNKQYFKQINVLWKAAALSSDETGNEVDKAYQRVQLQIYKQKKSKLHSKERSGNFDRRFSAEARKWAAVIILSLITGAGLYYLVQLYTPTPAERAKNEIVVPFGSKSRILLPDGSEVWLNAGSKLSYSMDYGKKMREVNLVGEGYFKVAHNPDKPFIVQASKVRIKALGTEFNVKAYPDENVIETILVKGSVVIDKSEVFENNTRKISQSIILKPGQKARIYKEPETKTTYVKLPETKERLEPDVKVEKPAQPAKENKINLQNSNTKIETSWKDERWIIKGENLDELLILLSRRFNITISLLSKNLSKYQFSGTIENETPEQVFRIMSLTIPMSYSIDKGSVEISLNKKLEEKYKSAYKKTTDY